MSAFPIVEARFWIERRSERIEEISISDLPFVQFFDMF